MPSTTVRPDLEPGFDWQRIETGHDDGDGWLHSGIAVLPDGSVVVAHPHGGRLVRVAVDGTTTTVPTGLTELHCITVGAHRDGPVLWVADNGHRYVPGAPAYDELRHPGRLVALALDGSVVQELVDPQAGGPWSPTSVAPVDPADAHGDLWVADGYGQSLLHRFAADGTLLATMDGSGSGAAFDCPHGLLVRPGSAGPELYVADRGRRRLVVFDVDGAFRRIVGAGDLQSPSSLAHLDGSLWVTELFGSVAVLEEDVVVGRLGAATRDHRDPAWPNALDERGHTVAPTLLATTFNSPHGITAHGGDLYLTEWAIGGRVLRLRRAPRTT